MSYDTREEHKAFREKYNLTTPLLMDEERKIGAAFGINTDGYPSRHTIVVSAEGKVADVITEIDFDSHAAQILKALE